MQYKTILFDLDGTLTDSAPGILNSVRYGCRRIGIPVPDEATLRRFLGPPLIGALGYGSGVYREVSGRWGRDTRREFRGQRR